MGNIKVDKRLMITIAGVAAVIVGCYLLIAPLLGKVHKVGDEVRALESEMTAVRQAVQSAGKLQEAGGLITRRGVSLAIDEIAKTGAAQNISFLSISPQGIMKPKGSQYPALPIQMRLQSDYKNLGLFLGSLERLKQSIVTVKSFQVNVDQDILPQIKADLVIEIYLQEGDDG